MIYFDNKPNALDDGSLEYRIKSTLFQLASHRQQLQKQIEDALAAGASHCISMRNRLFHTTNGISTINSLGEFQSNEMQRADVLIVQLGLVDEMIEQFQYIIQGPQEKENVAERAAHTELRIPERPAERKPAKRTGKSQGARASGARKESGSRPAKPRDKGGTDRSSARKR